MGGKAYIGYGCAAAVILLLILGGLGWWGYSHIMSKSMELNEMIEPMTDGSGNDNNDKGDNGNNSGGDFSDGDISSNDNSGNDNSGNEEGSHSDNGSSQPSMSEVADQNGFPHVTYDELPKNELIYLNKKGDTTILFAIMNASDGSVGAMTVNNMKANQILTFNMTPCGNSIYHMTSPDDESKDRYIFVYKGGKRILLGGSGHPMEFILNK